MNPLTPMTSLADVKSWLSTQNPGSTVDVSGSMFNAAMVNKLFDLLPVTPTVAVANSVIDIQNASATLSGTGTIIGQADTAISFVFTQPGTELLCSLSLVLAESVKWSLIQSFPLSFTQLSATFTPDEELKIISMDFGSNIIAGTTTAVSIPVNISVPSFDGDWTLSGSFTQIGSLTTDLLEAIAGNTDISSILPDELKIISNFQLTGFQMAFNPVKQTCSFIRVIIKYQADWKFFNDKFVVNGIFLDFEVFQPLSLQKSFQASLFAQMTLGGTAFEVGGQFPDKIVFANLMPDNAINLNSVFTFFQIPLPDNFPEVDISLLGFVFYTASSAFDFRLGITKPIPIAGNVSFDNFFFQIGASNNPLTGQLSPYGQISGQFSIVDITKDPVQTARIMLSAAYNSASGLDIKGEAVDIPIGALIGKLAASFGITELPSFITKIMLDRLKITYNTTSGNFTFNCKGSVPIAENTLTIELNLTALQSGTGYNKDIEASGTVTYKDQEFKLTFQKKSNDIILSAEWNNKGTPIGFATIAGLVGLADLIPDVPPELDLGLKSAKFTYDYTNTVFVLNAESSLFGKTVFVASKNIFNPEWVFFFGLSTDRTISLSNLPIIDKILSDSATLAIDAIQVDISSRVLTKDNAIALNKLINDYSPDKTYPNVPADGMASLVAFSMAFDIGGEKYPISLGTTPAGPASGTVSRKGKTGKSIGNVPLAGTSITWLPAENHALAPMPKLANGVARTGAEGSSGAEGDSAAAAASAATIWFNLQKSFGPLYFDKVGLSYQDGHIFVLVNVSATAGGLTIALNGFGIGVSISDFDVRFTISGIGITYVGGPILISGALQGSFDPVDLTGLVLLRVKTLTIGGIGGYTTVANKPSMFLYAIINYPIGGPAFFFITGLSAGFGYNRSLVIPDINGVANFPFVQFAMGGMPSPDPQGNIGEQVNKVLTDLIDKGTVAPAVGTNWLAAGIRFSSFQIIDSFALLNVIIGTTVEIDLLGLSRVIIPPGAGIPGSPVPIVARAELALKASYASGSGLVAIQGQLTSNSYVLSPDCHLTGGFAFYFWFSGDHAGDFVITLGGYNTKYTPPKYYPTVPKLGINWQVTRNLSIKGNEYFALTSNAVMAGGFLEAAWRSGSIKAWFSVQADFLIMWKPFYYDIRASVDIGASFTIDLWFTTKTITIHVGVGLHIWGPDFTGEATVDLSIISFTISFGASAQTQPNPITWTQFSQEMLPQKKKPAGAALTYTDQGPSVPPDPDVCKLLISNGLIMELSDVEGELNWVVSPEKFELTTTAVIPSKTWKFSENLTMAPGGQPARLQNIDFGVRPVNIKSADFASEQTVRITSSTGATFHAVKVLDNVSKALWQKIDFKGPGGHPAVGDPLNDTTLKDVLTGFTIVPYSEPAKHTLPIQLLYLQFTIPSKPQHFTWSDPYISTKSDFTGDTVPGTIESTMAVSNRNQLIKAININGLAVDPSIDVDGLASVTTDYLLAPPVLRLLGEEKKNGPLPGKKSKMSKKPVA